MTPTRPVFLLEENHDLPLCRIQVTVRTGSTTDAAEGELSGLCNFATELMRRGAGGKTRAELDEAADRLGASLHVLCSRDSVLFEVMALKEKLEPACRLLADVVLRPDFLESEADKLRRELRANLDDMRDDDGSLCWRFFYRALYGDHPYGRPVGGTEASLPGLSVARSRAWRDRYLKRGNLIFGAAGDLTSGEMEDLLLRHFEGLPEGPSQEEPLADPLTPQGLRLLLVDKPERTQSQIVLGQLAPRWTDPAWLPMRVATTAFGGTFTARLMDEVRVKRGLSYGASARNGAGRGRPMLWVHVFPSAAQTPETLELVLRLYREWAQDGLRDAEVEFARSYLAKGFAFRVETPEARLSLRTELELSGMPPDYPQTFASRVLDVTPAQVRDAMEQHLRPDDLVMTLVGTADTLDGPLGEVAALGGARRDTLPFDSY